MAARRRIDPDAGAQALRQWAQEQGTSDDEPAGAGSGAGPVHRRGTPPSVVETDAVTWLALATGRLTWQDALADGTLHASGERCDLSAYLPLVRLPG